MSNRNFTPFPVLTTGRLILRQLAMDDQQSVFTLRSDAAINKYLEREPASDNIKNNNSIYWVITLAETKTFAGTISLFNFSDEKNSCEIGYELMTEFQGQGIMKEAAEKVVDYVFQALQFQKIIAFAHNDNQHSAKLLTRLNFVKSTEPDGEASGFSTFTLTQSPSQP